MFKTFQGNLYLQSQRWEKIQFVIIFALSISIEKNINLKGSPLADWLLWFCTWIHTSNTRMQELQRRVRKECSHIILRKRCNRVCVSIRLSFSYIKTTLSMYMNWKMHYACIYKLHILICILILCRYMAYKLWMIIETNITFW